MFDPAQAATNAKKFVAAVQNNAGQVTDVTVTGNEIKGHTVNREAFRTFAPYRGMPKVTIFGSARTPREDPEYLLAEIFLAVDSPTQEAEVKQNAADLAGQPLFGNHRTELGKAALHNDKAAVFGR